MADDRYLERLDFGPAATQAPYVAVSSRLGDPTKKSYYSGVV